MLGNRVEMEITKSIEKNKTLLKVNRLIIYKHKINFKEHKKLHNKISIIQTNVFFHDIVSSLVLLGWNSLRI